MDDNLRIWRNFAMGNLLDLVMLDTRNYDRSITALGSFYFGLPARSYLG
jgi:alkaline phosphatase D